jgi:hypothetical protein
MRAIVAAMGRSCRLEKTSALAGGARRPLDAESGNSIFRRRV